MSDLYTVAVRRYLTDDGMDWAAASTDYRMLLFKQGTSGPHFDHTHATLTAVFAHEDNDECDDGTTYGRVTIAHTDRSVVNDGRKTQAHIDNPVDFDDLDNEEVGGALVYIHVDGTLGNDIPVAFLTSTDFPITTNGAGFTIDDGSDGLFEAEGVS